MSQFRASSIYVSSATRRLLRVIAKSEGPDTTLDEVGDRILAEAICQQYPKLVPFQKQIEGIEAEMSLHVKERL